MPLGPGFDNEDALARPFLEPQRCISLPSSLRSPSLFFSRRSYASVKYIHIISTGMDYYPLGAASRFYSRMSINFVNRAASSSRPGRELQSRACGAGKRWSTTMKEIIALFFGILFALNLIHATDSRREIISMLRSAFHSLLPPDYFRDYWYYRSADWERYLRISRNYIQYYRIFVSHIFLNFHYFFAIVLRAKEFGYARRGLAPLQTFSNVRLWKMNTLSPRVGNRMGIMRRLKNSP